MEPIMDITQKELTVVADNDLDKMGNKIKLRRSSHSNIVRHLKNVPFMVTETEKSSEVVTNAPSVGVDNGWTIVASESSLADGAKKPINVKANMLANLKKHGRTNDVSLSKDDSEINRVQDEHVNVEANPNNSIDINNKVEANPNNSIDINNKVEANTNNGIDINKTFEEVNNARNILLATRDNVTKAQEEMNDSDKRLQELGVQYNETEKQLQDAKSRKEEINQKIIKALASQTKTLDSVKKKYELLLEDINKKKEANENQIISFRSKIDDAKSELALVNDDIARQQEILNALSDLENADFMDTSDSEKLGKVRKVA